MNLKETLKIVTAIKLAYRHSFKDMDEKELDSMVKIWQAAFSDIPYVVVGSCLEKFLLISKYPPTIAELREGITEALYPTVSKTAEEAWGEVIHAVRRLGIYHVQEAMDSFDEVTKKAVLNVGFRDICLSENIGIERAHFFRSYEAYATRSKESRMTPNALLERINKFSLEHKAPEGQMLLEGD